jgi:hypothetical protein
MYRIERYLRPMSFLAFSWAMFQRLEDRIKQLYDVVDRCAICGKPIVLEQAKVTEDGRPVHSKCSAAKEP